MVALATDLPVGPFPNGAVQPHLEKYFAFLRPQINSITLAVRSHQRGVSRSSQARGWMRWTRQRRACQGITGRIALREWSPARKDEPRCGVRRRRVDLASVVDVKPAEVLRAQPGSSTPQSAGDGGQRNSAPGSNLRVSRSSHRFAHHRVMHHLGLFYKYFMHRTASPPIAAHRLPVSALLSHLLYIDFSSIRPCLFRPEIVDQGQVHP